MTANFDATTDKMKPEKASWDKAPDAPSKDSALTNSQAAEKVKTTKNNIDPFKRMSSVTLA